MSRLRLCVLISGSGTNLQALIDARSAGRLDIDIVHVISNVSSAAGLQRARSHDLPCSVLEHGGRSREAFDRELAVLMATGSPDLHVFAGFMRIVGEPVLSLYSGHMINLHPALLPKYPGLDTYRRALDAGDTVHGSSIHFLTSKLDGGPVITQVRVPIESGDTPERLAQRLAPQEHRLVVATIELFQQQNVECRGEQVVINGSPIGSPLQLAEDGALHAR